MAATYDLEIDLAKDLVVDIDVERKNTSTGELEAYSSFGSGTLLISATRVTAGTTPTAIHANLSKAVSERASTAGRIYATFDVVDLQAQLVSYVGQIVFLYLLKSGEVQYEPFRCLVSTDRLGL